MHRPYFRADATAIGGYIERPFAKNIPVQAPTALSASGGADEASTTHFEFEKIISAKLARTRVEGSFLGGMPTTRVTAVVEELNVLDTVRADELVAYISAKHPGEEPDVPKVDFGTTTINGLRVGDSILRVHLDLNLLNNGNGEGFPKRPHVYEKALWKRVGQKFNPDRRFLQCSLVEEIEVIRGKLPGKLVEPNLIEIPNFGRVHMAELLVSDGWYELIMMRFELGSPVRGAISVAGVRGGSTPGVVGGEDKVAFDEYQGSGELEAVTAYKHPPEAPPVAESGKQPKDAPRYTNICITKGRTQSVLPARYSLRARGSYTLRLNIGPWTRESVVRNTRPFRGDLLPSTEEGHWLEVIVASHDFRLEQRRHHIFLPQVGASYVCKCKLGRKHTCSPSDRQRFLFVPLVAPGLVKPSGEHPGCSPLRSLLGRRNPRSRQARLRIAIYYQKNLVESQLLAADVRSLEARGTGYSSRIDYSLTSHFSDLSLLPPRALNILTNDIDDRSHRLIINGDLKDPIAFNLTEGAIADAVDAARSALRSISVQETKGWGATVATYDSRYNDENEKDLDAFAADLRILAPLGRDLWTALLSTRPQARKRLTASLKRSARPATIQVSRVEGSSLAFPWSFIYDIPLGSDSSQYVTCRLLTRDNWKPEFIDTLDRCPFEHEHPTKDVLCPFGFWGFNHIVEQIPNQPEDRSLPLWIKRAHDKPQLIMCISLDLDAALTDSHKKKLQQKLTTFQVLPKDSLVDVELALAEEKLEIVYFYCHGRRQPLPGGRSSSPYIEVGKGQGIAPRDITTWHDSDWAEDHWKDTSPLVFINGCHTAELTPEVLVNFVDSFIGVYAAGVIGTEILLVQEVANEAAEEVLIRMNNKDTSGNFLGVGEALRQMRLRFLGKGNLLGLAYTAYCSANLKLSN